MELLRRTISALQRKFAMKDLGPLHHFLGITVERRSDGLFLHQRTYMFDILKWVVMADCKPCTTPADLQAKLADDLGPPIVDVSQFQSIVGALQYLTFTRPDIAYVVQQICLHMHDPREPHLTVMKRILRYLRGMPDFGLLLRCLSSSDLVIYTDVDWDGYPDTRRSMVGYVVFLVDNLVFWSVKRQTVVSRSSAEAEYRVIANGVAEATWLRQLLHELQARHHAALPSTVTTSTPCTSPSTPFSISARSMWRLIFISSERRLPSIKSASYMSRRHRSSPTSS
jgi:hypothetical protein